MKIDGRCHCGYVTYEAEIDPALVSACHCTDCQILSGSPFRVTVPAVRASIRLTGHEPRAYTKTADSGRKRRQFFCPECGSPLFAAGETDAEGNWSIRWGSIRQRRDLPPLRRIWCQSAPDWIDDLATVPRRETS